MPDFKNVLGECIAKKIEIEIVRFERIFITNGNASICYDGLHNWGSLLTSEFSFVMQWFLPKKNNTRLTQKHWTDPRRIYKTSVQGCDRYSLNFVRNSDRTPQQIISTPLPNYSQ
jgi:hypothetical protein